MERTIYFELNNKCLSRPTIKMSDPFILKWRFQRNVLLCQKSIFVEIFGKEGDIRPRQKLYL
uniref:Photosystem II protein L n=1 Tax=Laurus azorica TaxID=136121 RepID=A0A411LWC1_9MAGN|nr:photosystem II protein L [Laurus azorica]